ncbi:MAG: hypothetical protein ACRDPY_10415 [Streptosporangiaceae bacterium]
MSKPYEISPHHRCIAGLMFLAAVSLAVESALHLSDAIHPKGSNETQAGAAEAVICVALLWGACSLAVRGAAGYRVALGTTVFAIAGFILGLSITVPSGYIPDIAYHAVVLPILIVTLALIVGYGRPGAGAGQAPRQGRQALRH